MLKKTNLKRKTTFPLNRKNKHSNVLKIILIANPSFRNMFLKDRKKSKKKLQNLLLLKLHHKEKPKSLKRN